MRLRVRASARQRVIVPKFNTFSIIADLFAPPRFTKRAQREAQREALVPSPFHPKGVRKMGFRISLLDDGSSRCAAPTSSRLPGPAFRVARAIGGCADPRAADGAP